MFSKKLVAKEEVMHENSELTNHDCFANVFRERGFRKFSTAQIGKLLQEEYPNFSLGSILPNDHAKGNAASCWCVGTPQQIFNKVRRGFYRVRHYQHLESKLFQAKRSGKQTNWKRRHLAVLRRLAKRNRGWLNPNQPVSGQNSFRFSGRG